MTDRTPFKLNYLVMPNSLYKETRLSLTAIKVYLFIHAYTNPFFFGNEHLGEMFGCTDQAISDAIKKLEELKYVHCEYKPRGGGGKIRLVIDDYSDYNKMTSRKKIVEATTSHSVVSKEEKVNNIKENFFEKTSREQRPPKRGLFGNYAPRPQYPYPPKIEKKGSHAENIF